MDISLVEVEAIEARLWLIGLHRNDGSRSTAGNIIRRIFALYSARLQKT